MTSALPSPSEPKSPIPALARHEPEGLPTSRFAWGCRVQDRLRFTYFYGAIGDCLDVAQHRGAGDVMHKGVCDTFAEARGFAQERATELAAFYEGIGKARALTALALQAELDRPVRPAPGLH